MPSAVRSPLNKQIRAPKTAELIAAQIRGQIVRRELQPGMTLPTEGDLMVQLGVSRPTLREAYRILETESLISVRRGVGGGALVLTPDVSVGARYVGLLLQLDGATIADVYEARMALEPVCAGMMAARRNGPDLEALQQCCAEVAELIAVSPDGIPEPHEWSSTTYRFHELVLQGSGNKTLALQGALLQEVVATHYAATVPDKFAQNNRPERFRRVLLSFRKLAKLVADGDNEGAHKHWLKHMQTAAGTLLGEDMKNKRIVDLFN
ncbi:FadR/GntR family transcriptional regulator [uncultured Jatrophihabitans sp.]|uniref:FadR/GntR family transcriptional regulator n=1 Tax=uncultured Jatrophihabitans sp. TaxID=1610747 RepID=UPI0035CAC555